MYVRKSLAKIKSVNAPANRSAKMLMIAKVNAKIVTERAIALTASVSVILGFQHDKISS
jgi:hypothetical protein